jgi:hypothetical protein
MTLAAQIAALQTAPVAELAAHYAEVFGHPPRSRRNAAWLRKRIAHKLQVVALGGLPKVAQAALDRLTAEIVLPSTPVPSPTPSANTAPLPGRVLQREWRGQTVRVISTTEGFEWNGLRFGSLSAVAFAVTGAKWNGRLFFGLTERKAKP